MLTWNGHIGAASTADYYLHLTDDRGRSLCGYAPSQLVPVTHRDFKLDGEVSPKGLVKNGWCDTCRERGHAAPAASHATSA